MSNTQAEMAEARGKVYELLSLIYLREMTLELLKKLRAPEFAGLMAELGIAFDTDFLDRPEDPLIEDMAAEYARLFVVPGSHVSPHESVYTGETDDRNLWGAAVPEVKRFLARLGIHLNPDHQGVMPDHVAVELAIMLKLCEREAQAWSEDDADSARRCLELEMEFMTQHLMRWAPSFCDEVLDRKPSSFYGTISRLTKEFLDFDIGYIGPLAQNAARPAPVEHEAKCVE